MFFESELIHCDDATYVLKSPLTCSAALSRNASRVALTEGESTAW